ncbi:MAG: hypothetical protein ACP5RI_03090 [Candidatus Micrarchaeia archaeon]
MLKNVLSYHNKKANIQIFLISFILAIMLAASIIELFYNIDKSFVDTFISNYINEIALVFLSTIFSAVVLKVAGNSEFNNEIKIKIAVAIVGIAIALVIK